MTSAFSYKQGNSILHRCPTWIKILFLPAVSIAVFMLPWQLALAIIILQTIAGFCLRFTLREQLCDLRAVLYYAAFLIFAKIIGAVFSQGLNQDFFTDFLPTLFLLLKLLCLMQTASLVFKTSTPLQIRQGLEKMEVAVRKILHLKNKTTLSQTLALFVCFIPQVSKNWNQIKKAWFARGGKKSIRMLVVLLPVLFSLGVKQAYNSARAIAVRASD